MNDLIRIDPKVTTRVRRRQQRRMAVFRPLGDPCHMSRL